MTASMQEFLPLIYAQLKQLANREMSRERLDHTLQPTALINEVYVRLSKDGTQRTWDSPGHFFTAAAEAMRRILVDHARHHNSLKRGGDRQQVPFTDAYASRIPTAQLLSLDDALTLFEKDFPRKAALVKLRYFAGMSHQEAAESLQISRATADRDWAFAKVWLYQQIETGSPTSPGCDTEASADPNSH